MKDWRVCPKKKNTGNVGYGGGGQNLREHKVKEGALEGEKRVRLGGGGYPHRQKRGKLTREGVTKERDPGICSGQRLPSCGDLMRRAVVRRVFREGKLARGEMQDGLMWRQPKNSWGNLRSKGAECSSRNERALVRRGIPK